MDKKLTSKELISKDLSIKTKQQLFEKIASLLQDAQLIKNKKDIYDDLVNREKQGSTAFEHGLVIPHARSSALNETKVVVVEFADSDFESLDGQKSNFAVSIIVPKKAEEEHLKVLSKISGLLSTKEQLKSFRELSDAQKVETLNNLLIEEEVDKTEDQPKVKRWDFVAVTSCAAGIAHTYMAKDALLNAAKKLGLKAKVETRGAHTENILSKSDIDGAGFVIIAADVAISKKPFLGKKILVVSTNDAIRNAELCIKEAKEQKINYGKGEKLGKLSIGSTQKKNNLGKSLMYAISWMIPVVIVGGIMISIPNALAAGGTKSGGTWSFPNQAAEALWNFGHIGLLMMVPILSMFLAYKIGGKPAIPAALIGGYFINSGELMGKYSLIDIPKEVAGDASAGYLGGLVVGIFVGYLVKWMQWINWHKSIKPIVNLMFVPVISGFLTWAVVLYVIGSPMTFIMSELYYGLSQISSEGIWVNILIGGMFAAMMSIDLGGPINKTALVVASAIFADTITSSNPNFVPQTAVQAAGSVASIGMWLSTICFKRKFSTTEKSAGAAALPMGLVGICEGALPFAFATPLKALIANVTGSFVAGALVTIAGIHFYGGLGSPLGAYIGYMENSFWGLAWIGCTLCGAFVTAMIYGFLRKKDAEYEAAYLEARKEKMEIYRQKGLTKRIDIYKYLAKNSVTKLPEHTKRLIDWRTYIKKPENWGEEQESGL